MSSLLTSPTNVNAATLGLPDIAFIGKAGAGKSTAADLLVSLLGYRKLSFAAPLKDIAATLWGHDARTDRDKLQRLGVAVRDIEPDTWVAQLVGNHLRAPRDLFGSSAPYAVRTIPSVIDDCRFENEAAALKGEGFVIVRMFAPMSLRTDRLKGNGKWQDDSQLEHVSETALDDLEADYTVVNDGSPSALEEAVVAVVLRERKRR